MTTETSISRALANYEIGTELGRGAFGVVLAGRHRQLGREVAIKQLSPRLVSNESVRSRFLAEAQILASIEHPHIVPVYDYVEQEDACILVMERLGGGTVWSQFVARGFDQRSACAIALVVCSGLSGAHQRGVLHRDMKPENVLFGHDSTLKVTDFGIARVLGQDDTLATREGEILGTPDYMAPEQATGSNLGPSTDIYAAGVMLYELLSGRLPYPETGGSLATLMRHMNEEPTPLQDIAPTVPPDLIDAVMRAIARDPADRFQSAEDFGVAIGRAASAAWGATWLEDSGILLREPGPIFASAHRGTGSGDAWVPTATDVVRPVQEIHTAGPVGTGIALNDLMPLRQTPSDIPPFPRVLVWVASALAAVTLVLGLIGITSPGSPSLGPGVLTVAGHDPATNGVVHANLDQPIPITVNRPPAGVGKLTTAQLVLRLGDVPVVDTTSVPFSMRNGIATTTVDASAGRYIIAGKLAATLKLSGTRGNVSDSFELQADRSPFATFLGVVGIVLLLMVVAYGESLLRSLRRGRRWKNRGAIAGMTIVGILLGLTATLWGWMFEISAPTLAAFLVPAAVGGIAGLIAGLAGKKMGDRARARRLSNRLVLVARRRTLTGSQSLPRVEERPSSASGTSSLTPDAGA